MFRADDHSDTDLAPLAVRTPGYDGVGLGDTLKTVISLLGIKPCSRCQRRAEALNRIRLGRH